MKKIFFSLFVLLNTGSLAYQPQVGLTLQSPSGKLTDGLKILLPIPSLSKTS